eukprot:TRINITY_DN2297_c0_g1_i1.p1 TRINITY_DN2297_c0_g1~~TRINITY_DN2297_c0_g1_i1.p1  ORF type:complete len:737 (+),score=224.09 TRINITY_DN2297_c0_g1_i1:62-2212(+)
MDDILILFEAEASVVRRDAPASEPLVGEAVVAYHPATQDHKVAVYIPDGPDGGMAMHICTLRNYQYELDLPVAARRAASVTYFDLKLDSGKSVSLRFAHSHMGVAFAGYIIGIMWFVGERAAPVVLVVKDGPDGAAPLEHGHTAKVNTMAWQMACLNSYDAKAFKIADITEADKQAPTKRRVAIGSKEVPLLEQVLLGRKKKDKLLVAGDGMIMFVDVASTTGAGQPPTPSHSSLGGEVSSNPSIGASFAAFQPQFAGSPPHYAHTPPRAKTHRDVASPASTRKMHVKKSTMSACSDSVASHDLENPRLTLNSEAWLASASKLVGHTEAKPLLHGDGSPPAYPVDLYGGGLDIAEMVSLHSVPARVMLHMQRVLSSRYFIALRVGGCLAIYVAWLMMAAPAQVATASPALPVGLGAGLTVAVDLLHLTRRVGFDQTLCATVAYRNHMHRSTSDTDRDLMNARCLGGAVVMLSVVVGAVVFSAMWCSTASAAQLRRGFGPAVLAPLAAVTMTAAVLRFAVQGAVLRGLLADAIPELAKTAGGRRDFAFGHQKWLPTVVVTWGAARQVVNHAAHQWAWVLLAAVVAAVHAPAAAIWYFALDPVDPVRAAGAACAFAVVAVLAALLDSWHRANAAAAAAFLRHYEWRHSEEAAKVLRAHVLAGEAPLWHAALAYFQTSLAVPAVWFIGPFRFPDGIFKLVATLAVVAAVVFAIWAVVYC